MTRQIEDVDGHRAAAGDRGASSVPDELIGRRPCDVADSVCYEMPNESIARGSRLSGSALGRRDYCAERIRLEDVRQSLSNCRSQDLGRILEYARRADDPAGRHIDAYIE